VVAVLTFATVFSHQWFLRFEVPYIDIIYLVRFMFITRLFANHNLAFIGYLSFSIYVHTVNLFADSYCDQFKRQLEMAIE